MGMNAPPIWLEKGEMWIAPRPGAMTRIECLRGSVWITQTGERRDIVLTAGQSHVPGAKGRLAAQALSAAEIRVRRCGVVA
jgi:ferric-dicitrate binding protein FerR (iron transport regulator)